MELYDQVLEAVQAIQIRTSLKPEVGVILGSGLGDLATEIAEPAIVPYADIPHFARSTVKGHAGRLIIGLLENVPVVAMQGRFHLYEGYPLQVLTLPVRVMRQLGAHTLIVTNAAGGVNHAEVLAAADAVRPRFAALVRGIVREIPRLIATS